MLETLMEKALQNVNEITKICMIGNKRYLSYLDIEALDLDNYQVDQIELDEISFQELEQEVVSYGMDTLLVMVLPLWVEGYSRKEIFEWLMLLEEKGMYILNITVGVEDLELGEKAQAVVAKLFNKVVTADNTEMLENNKFYYTLLNKKNKMLIKDTNGSRITFEIDKVIVENDSLDQENRVIQIPAGEVFVVPKRGSVNGVLVLNTKEGREKIVIDKDFADLSFIDESFYLPVGEVGFGTNPNIPDIWSLPYSEKKSGTFHLGFGRNKNFGGEYVYDIHFDLISEAKEFKVEIYEENSD